MQRGIDSFFKRVPKSETEHESSVPKKRKKVILSSSDEDEVVVESPQVVKKHERKKTRPNDEKSSPKGESSKKLAGTAKELKKIDPTALFSGETKRVQAPKPPKPKEPAIIELDDDEIDKSLMEVDIDESIKETGRRTPRKTKRNDDDNERNQKNTPKKSESNDHKSSRKISPTKKEAIEKKTPTKRNGNHLEAKRNDNDDDDRNQKKSPKKTESNDEHKSLGKVTHGKEEAPEKKTPSKRKGDHLEKEHANQQKPRKRSKSREKTTPPEPSKVEELQKTPASERKPKTHTPRSKKQEHHGDSDSSILTDEERHERKRLSAILYQKYKNRSSCLNHGCKEVPKGKPNCLAGLSFVVSGVLESLERDEANSIIKEYGGKVSTTVGKRLNYLIVGEDAGPKKLAQADELGIKILSEDGFFDLIRERSGEKLASSTKKEEKSPTLKDEKVTTPIKEETKVKIEKTTPKIPKVQQKIKKEEDNNNLKADSKISEVKTDAEQQLEKPVVDENMLAWVDKYKPSNVKEIIGQQGAASNVVKLTNWLSKWYSNHDGKKKLQKPNPWAKNDDGSYYKAALLSGPPGIGKTTTANLVCKELGFDVVEFNASDTRSKRLLKEEVAELLSNKSLYGFCHGNTQAVTKKHVLIMDEVDGMAGNEDRGGIQELIALIKDSSVPIICMCNDRNHQKMRSLVNYCYDLRFQRPRLEQIKGRLLSILCKEKIKIDPAKLEEIISATNNDIRQSINYISMLSANKDLNLKTENIESNEKTAEKDMKMGPWDVVRKVFSADEHKRMSIYDKCDLFFHDYSLAPLFVQQNYLQVSPQGPKSELLQKVAMTADSLSLGDLVDKRIRSRSAWALLPTMAAFSSYMPGEYMCGHFTGQINFPGWLGKNSRANKRSRMAQEIHDHTRLRTSGSRLSIRLDYAPFLLDKIVRPLKELGMEGVEQSLNVIKEYHLLREDIDSLLELTSWPGKKQAFESVDGRVKAALTRTYNKEVLAYSYSAAAGVKKKRAEAMDDDGMLLGEGEEGTTANNGDSDDDKDDDLENDGLIKTKKKAASTATKTQKDKPSSSKPKGASTSKSGGGTGKARATNSKKKK